MQGVVGLALPLSNLVAALRAAVAALEPPLRPAAAAAGQGSVLDVSDAFVLDIGSAPGTSMASIGLFGEGCSGKAGHSRIAKQELTFLVKLTFWPGGLMNTRDWRVNLPRVKLETTQVLVLNRSAAQP